MKVYRDCINGVPPFDIPAFMTIFTASGSVYTTLQVPLSYSLTVPPSNNSPCAPTTAGNACVEEAYYEATINLPPLTGGYYIAYQRCCRNNTILNLIGPGSVGATYWEHIPGPEVVTVNSSPRFTFRPPIYICSNLPIAFNHVATDPDGDSLVYSICSPFDGLDPNCPLIDGTGTGGSCPLTNTAPPYVGVPFSPPYSSSYPMASNPAININPHTGFLNGNPTIQGQWVVGICVEEYRNGQLIGTHHRDFQFNVIACPFVVVADIVGQTTTNNGQGTGYCNGFTISYHNNSFNGSTYFWDFGDPGSTTDTSSAYNPTYTFPHPGTYTVTLVVDPGSPCADTTTKVFQVYPLLSPDFIQPNAQCFNGNNFNFSGGGLFQGNGTFNWNFGTNATPSSASTLSVTGVTYNAPGQYQVSFTVNENGCTATSTKTIEVFQSPVAAIGSFTGKGCDPYVITFPNLSTAGTPMTYLWTFSDGTTSTAPAPTHTFSPQGVYSVSLSVMTNQNCIDTSRVTSVNTITVNATPTANFNSVSATGFCFNNNNFAFNHTGTSNSSATFSWDFGANASQLTATTKSVTGVSYNAPGIYTISLVVDENGCADSSEQYIQLYENTLAAIDPPLASGCSPYAVSFNNLSTGSSNLAYSWVFSDGFTSNEANPTHIFSNPGVYDYTLTVSTSQNCIETDQLYSTQSITVNPSPMPGFIATPSVTSIFDPDVSFYNTSNDDIVSWTYDFADGSGSNDPNPAHTYANWGNYEVTQTVINTYGCPNRIKVLVKILPEFRFWVPNAFTPKNKDNLNDVFKPIVIGVEEYEFDIFDRWGELIYKTEDTEAGWNGTYKNQLCTDDVYIWKCTFKNVVTAEHESHVGHVTLVR